jgi:hypothetical protein
MITSSRAAAPFQAVAIMSMTAQSTQRHAGRGGTYCHRQEDTTRVDVAIRQGGDRTTTPRASCNLLHLAIVHMDAQQVHTWGHVFHDVGEHADAAHARQHTAGGAGALVARRVDVSCLLHGHLLGELHLRACGLDRREFGGAGRSQRSRSRDPSVVGSAPGQKPNCRA